MRYSKSYFTSFFNYVCLTFSLFFLSFKLRAFSLNYYVQQFRIHGISEITGKRPAQLRNIAQVLIDFLKKGDTRLLTPYFNEKEVLHMMDVYQLFHLMYIIQIILLICILGLSIKSAFQHRLKPMWRQTGWLLSFNYLLLGLGFWFYQTTDFNTLFFRFHEIFFTNDLWLLDPTTDLMIQMLPEPFFAQITLETIVLWIILTLLVQIFILFLSRRISTRIKHRLSNIFYWNRLTSLFDNNTPFH